MKQIKLDLSDGEIKVLRNLLSEHMREPSDFYIMRIHLKFVNALIDAVEIKEDEGFDTEETVAQWPKNPEKVVKGPEDTMFPPVDEDVVQFFMDNPEPTEEEVERFIRDTGKDASGVHRAIYAIAGSFVECKMVEETVSHISQALDEAKENDDEVDS